MPTINIPVYFSEENYIKYLKKKDELHEKVREYIKKEMKR